MVPPPAKKEREDHLPLTRHSASTDLHVKFQNDLILIIDSIILC
jgi:hypothetical protein